MISLYKYRRKVILIAFLAAATIFASRHITLHRDEYGSLLADVYWGVKAKTGTAVRHHEFLNFGIPLLMWKETRYWTNYTWSTANGNILINKTNYPTLTYTDTVFIPKLYWRSFSFAKIGSSLWDSTQYITVQFDDSAIVSPGTTAQHANSFDSSFHVKINGFKIIDGIDVAFDTYATTGYSQYIWFNGGYLRGQNGFFQSADPNYSFLPDYGGNPANRFDHMRWTGMLIDSLVGGNSGNTALWIGVLSNKGLWTNTTIEYMTFAHYSSLGGPANYIQAKNQANLIIRYCRFIELGKNIGNPVGHASSVFLRGCKYWIYGNIWGPDNFGTDIRDFGTCEFAIDASTLGKSYVWNNITYNKRKYAFIECQPQLNDTVGLTYLHNRTSPEIYNTTYYNGSCGVGNTPYNFVLYERYRTKDTIVIKNNVVIGVRDTVPTNFGPALSAYSGGTIISITWDSASNKVFTTFVGNVLDTNYYYRPISGGYLDGTGVPGITTIDIYGKPVPVRSRWFIGAVSIQDLSGALPRRKRHHKPK